MDKEPIFLFGMERSGTTLLSMIVGAHPDIAVPFATTGMWFDFHSRLDDYNNLADVTGMSDLVDDVLAHERIKLWDASLSRKQILSQCQLESFPSVISAFHQAYANAKGKQRWGNIDIANLDNTHLLADWFPDAKFLHIIRDGRDVALSHATMPYNSGNLAECAYAWERRVMTNLRIGAVLGSSRYKTIRYEDLLQQPQRTTAEICDFLNVEASANMIAYQEMVADKVPADRMWLWPQLDKQLDPSKVGQWKSRMKRNQRAVFEDIAGPLLRELGYETFDEVPATLGRFVLETAYFLDRGARWKRLKQKMGIREVSKLEKAAGQRKTGS